MSGSDRVGVAVIGAGIMGSAHAGAVAADHRSDLVGVASAPVSGATELATRYGAIATADYQELVHRADVDLVIVATPDHLHTTIALAAAEAGKAMLVEKPLATNLADADALIDVVDTAGVPAMTCFNHRWIPAYAQAHTAIRSGEIGDGRLAYARKNDRIHVPTSMLTWANATSPAWFLSSHDIDLVCWFFDELATEVYATQVRGVLDGIGINTPDAVQAQVRFSSDAVATFEACWIYPNSFPSMTDSFIEVVGTEGVIHLDRKDDQLEIASGRGHEYPRTSIMPVLHGQAGGALALSVSHMIECVLTGSAPLVSLASSRHVTAVLEAIHTSIERDTAVAVAL